jgi:hypothetical protein
MIVHNYGLGDTYLGMGDPAFSINSTAVFIFR